MPLWSNLEVEPLFEERVLPLASPAFIRRHRLKKPEELQRAPLIQSAVCVVQWSDWFAIFISRTPTFRWPLATLSNTHARKSLPFALHFHKISLPAVSPVFVQV